MPVFKLNDEPESVFLNDQAQGYLLAGSGFYPLYTPRGKSRAKTPYLLAGICRLVVPRKLTNIDAVTFQEAGKPGKSQGVSFGRFSEIRDTRYERSLYNGPVGLLEGRRAIFRAMRINSPKAIQTTPPKRKNQVILFALAEEVLYVV